MKDLIGTTLGKYSIVARLGYGGMATVYKAHQPRLDRYVALKVLHSHLAEEANFVTRFEREAEAAARLTHPHIVRIYDFDADDGLYYMVMEWIQGPTLKDEMAARRERQQPLTIKEIVRIAIPLADAIGYAHANGVIHRDLKPSNVMLTPEQRVVLTDFGLAYIVGEAHLTATNSTSGTPEYMSPEQAKGETCTEASDLYSLGVILYELATGRLPFEGETRFATLMSHITSEAVRPTQINPDVPLALEEVILTAMRKDPAERYQSAEEMSRALQVVVERGIRTSETPIAILAPVPQMDATTESSVLEEGARPRPYRGLFAFREEDAPMFFGRDTFTARLVQVVRESAMVAVVGPSGSGKSSVVFAGLIPHLRAEADWAIATFHPGSRPFHALADALVPLLATEASEVDRLVETRKMAQSLGDGTLPLSDVLERILQKSGDAKRLMLVADQFEELYTLCPDPDVRRRFTAALLDTVRAGNGRDSSFALTLTLRADFMGQALSDRSFAEALQKADVKLGPMTREELTEAIERPAAQLGVSFEPGLVERILDDVGDEPGNLPLLEFALTLLWDRRAGRRLTHAAYEAIGRVEGALARYAEKVYAKLGEDERLLARRVFTQMVRPGAGTEDTRRRASRAELGDEGWALVRRLADERLVVTGEDAGQETAEVVHEVLIRGWRRLQEWMAGDREFRSWQERLRAAVLQWESAGHDEAVLLRGSLLAEAERWLAVRTADVSAAEREFVEAGVALRGREAAEREAQRQRELEAARKLAQEQQQRAEEQTRAARKLRTRAWFLGGAMVVAAVLAVLAVVFGRQSQQNAEYAEERRIEAEAHQAEAETQRAEAEAQRQEAEHQRQISLSRQLAAQSTTLLEDQIDLALLLGLEANRTADSAETRSSLLRALQQEPALATILHGQVGAVQSVAFSPDGRLLASVGADSVVWLWAVDYPTGGTPVVRPFGEPLAGHEVGQLVNDVAFSPDGAMLATASDDLTVRLWDVSTGQLLSTLTGHTVFAQTVVFGADGRTVISGGGDNTVRVWDVATGELLHTLEGHISAVWHLAIAPDGRTLASASEDATIVLWDLTSDPPQGRPLVGHAGVVYSAAFSPDGQTLASVDVATPTVRLWDVVTGQQVGELQTDHTGAVAALAFVGSQTLATRSNDGTIRFWDLGSGERVGEPIRVWMQGLLPIAVSPDGRLLAAGSGDGAITLWDLSGELWLGGTVLAEQTDLVRSASFHPDGRTIAVSSYDGFIRFYDSETGDLVGEPLVFSSPEVMPVSDLAIDPARDRLIVARSDGTLTSWDLASGEATSLRRGHVYGAVTARFTPDGRWLTSGGADDRVAIWSGPTNRPATTMLGQPGRITSMAYGPGRYLVAIGNSQGVVWCWEAPSAYEIQLKFEITAHESGVRSAAISTGGEWLATGDEEGNIGLWDMAEGQPLARFDAAHAGAVLDLAFLAAETETDTPVLLSVGADGRVLQWNFTVAGETVDGAPTLLRQIQGDATVTDGVFSGQAVALGSDDGQVQVWDLTELSAEPLLLGSAPGGAAVLSVAFEGQRVAVGVADGSVRLWDLDSPDTFSDLLPDAPPVVSAMGMAYSPDGQTLAAAGYNGTVILWDVATGQPLYPPLVGHSSSITALTFSPDGRRVATGSCARRGYGIECAQGEVIVWDVSSGQVYTRMVGLTSYTYGLAFSPDGETLAASGCGVGDVFGYCNRGQVLFWDLTTGELAHSLEGHARDIAGIAFSPDGRLFASGGNDASVMLWDTTTWQQVGRVMRGHSGGVETVAFSPDGTLLASAGSGAPQDDVSVGSEMILWDVATGQPIGDPFTDQAFAVYGLAFSPDGRRLASASLDRTVIVWDMDLESWRERACRIANRNLTPEEWTQFFGSTPYRETCGGQE